MRSERAPRTNVATRPGLAIGTNVGRYVVLGLAGQGGFGVVYRAYDPELDRQVALKLLDADARDDVEHRKVMLAEARALAKIRHANIVAVYDVGEFDGRGFVAMEYVAGCDLGQWQEQRQPSWAMTSQVLAKAAWGLAAAHDAGIVHRDFKPSNVLVAESGEVYVADFGLARTLRHPQAGGHHTLADHDQGRDGELPPGTPAYLAPELYAGEEPSATSDVFAFCVAAWEVAFGSRPWSVTDETELLAAKREGPPVAPRGTGVPSAVAAVLRAGLSADPNARPSSAHALASALSGDSGRRWWGLAALATLGVVAAGAWWMRAGDPCAHVTEAIESVWAQDSRQALRDAVDAAGVADADETWSKIEQNTEAWAQRWRDERTEACRATHVRHEHSAALLDRRMSCLERELGQLDALLAIVRAGDAQEVARAPRALAKLAAGLRCDAERLVAERADPTGAEADAVVADIDRVSVLEAIARYDEGLELAVAVQERASAMDAVGLKLRAQYRRARLLDLTGDGKAAVELHEAVHWEAEAQGWDDVAASAGLDVMYGYAAVLSKPEVAMSWAPHVSAAITRAGDDVRRRASHIDARGVALLYLHEVEQAREAHEEALALRETYDNDGLDTVVTLQNLGIVYEELHRYDEAIAQHHRAAKILATMVGDSHPHTARVIDNLGTAQLRKGDTAEATENFERALEIRRTVLGPEHRTVALSTVHLAHAALAREDVKGAIEQFQAGLRLYEKVNAPGSRNIVLCHEGLAHAYYAAGDREAANRHAQQALDGLPESLPDDHPEVKGLRGILSGEL